MNNSTKLPFPAVTAAEASTALAISRQTLYAYVSRGLVRAAQDPADARKSLYNQRDIETLLTRKQRGRSRRQIAASTLEWGEPVLNSSITRIAEKRFYYRGIDAVQLSRTATLEEIAQRLARVPIEAASEPQRNFTPPDLATPLARMMQTMTQAAIEPGRRDGPAEGGRLLRLMALSAAGISDTGNLPIHALLAKTWTDDSRAPDLLRRALVLCADHELNASAYGTRVTASTGASLPACLLAGLATLSGPRHGGIVDLCRAWMIKTAQKQPSKIPAPSDTATPGFGHPLYPDGDPRPEELFTHFKPPKTWTKTIRAMEKQHGLRPGLDLALAALEAQLNLPRGAGFAIFAVGRTAGWLAHIFEQRRSGQIIRPRAFSNTEPS